MLKKERQKRILDILSNTETILSSDLAIILNVSEDTIRRDLNELGKNRLVDRIHGGASRSLPKKSSYEKRFEIDSKEKKELAKVVARIIPDGSVLLIDGGTTNLYLVKELKKKFKGTIFTNSPIAAHCLGDCEQIETILLGGKLSTTVLGTTGLTVFNTLSSIVIDWYVMGVTSVDVKSGLTVSSFEEVELKRAMMNVSKNILGIATKEKIGKISNYKLTDIDCFTKLFVNGEKAKEFKRSKNVEILNFENKEY